MERYSDEAIKIIDELHTERLDYESEYMPLINCAIQCKAYEDTGLEPETVERMKLSMMGKALAEITEFEGIPIDRLRELANAEQDGRCVVLPCKVGDTAFVLETEDEDGGDDRIFEGTIVAIHIGAGGITVTIGRMENKCWFSETERRVPDLNVDWFLTRAEAEAALGGGGDD